MQNVSQNATEGLGGKYISDFGGSPLALCHCKLPQSLTLIDKPCFASTPL